MVKVCVVCGKVLEVNEVRLCGSCFEFLVWKYGSLENYQKVRRKMMKFRRCIK